MLLNLPSDILLTIANLSSDEIFTPPRVADYMLDMLPQNLFESPDTKFLDPACKSGIFLREIAKRLINGLKDKIPDLNTRLNHIFANQLYGIAITELTALMARRTLYCSKDAGGKYSVVSSAFENSSGNIRFELFTKHKFEKGKCVYCGAAEKNYNRDENLESHAYEFIHRKFWGRIYEGMKFDVIISNPPYQLSDGGHGRSATPIYQNFVEQAKKLNPKYISMIIPARWYAGGKGLDEFRAKMLSDTHIKELHDFPNAAECFPDTQIKGGVCYFLWDSKHNGNCKIFTHSGGVITESERPLKLDGVDTFIRFKEGVSILNKVQALNENSFAPLVSQSKPFGLRTDFLNDPAKYDLPPVSEEVINDGIKIIGLYSNKQAVRYVNKDYPFPSLPSDDAIYKWKIFISNSYGAGENFPHQILNKPFIAEPNTACTETYLLIGPFDDKAACQNVISYIATKFFRFLVLLIKGTQHATQAVYKFVPVQDFNKSWTDEELYAKYKLEPDEIDFIESMIKPMELK